MSQRSAKLVLGIAALALVTSGCRAGGDDVATGVGVSSEACPKAVNEDNGCIYLGTISDLTGPFAPLAVPVTEGQKAFWNRVNENGGIGGYDIDVASHVRDDEYNPQIHSQAYQEIKGEVLALAQTLGSPTTAAILDDMKAANLVGTGASWSSKWAFEDNILDVGSTYCYDAMNLVDYAVDELGVQNVMAVHYPGDAGDDAAAGVKMAASNRDIKFTDVSTQVGPDNQGGAIDQVVSKKPDVVIMTTSPTDAAAIVGQSAARGYKGKFLGSNPTWSPGLLKSPAADALKESYLVSDFYPPFGADTPGHKAMRNALGDVEPNDGYVYGWIWSYPLKAALEKAAESGNLTREGLLDAAKSLQTVDYEGMLPPEAGNQDEFFRKSLIRKVDEDAATGTTVIKDLFAGPSAQEITIKQPCYEQ